MDLNMAQVEGESAEAAHASLNLFTLKDFNSFADDVVSLEDHMNLGQVYFLPGAGRGRGQRRVGMDVLECLSGLINLILELRLLI